MTFLDLARKVIEKARRPLSPSEIWEIAKAKGYDRQVSGKGKTAWATLGARLYVDVQNSGSAFIAYDSRPKRFFLKELVDKTSARKITEGTRAPVVRTRKLDYLEKDLHRFLAYYAYNYLRLHVKTLRASAGARREFGEWVHPDVVGCYFPFGEWTEEVVDLSSELGSTAVRLYSFELKRELSFSNLREAFFQTVSNSSWSNEGYLAASVIDTNKDFRAELKRLSTSFGIGIIGIDVEGPDTTEVIFPARPREVLDWDAINKLTINADFKSFLKRVRKDMSVAEAAESFYDRVIAREDLISSIRR
jgi:hypothetical protein